jgi:DNA-binding response OmpR family regulator/PAS domain-containing protein
VKNPTGLINALDEPIFELGLDGKVLSATSAARSLAGDATLATDALTVLDNWTFANIVSTRDRNRFEQAFKRVAEGKTNGHRLELSIVAASGNASDALPMEAKLAGITAANGKPTSVGLWLRDLSLEKANEAAANVQGTHLLDLVDNVTDACVVESADGSVEMLNESFCRLFEIREAPQSLVGTSCAALFETASQATEKRIGPVYFPLDASTGSNQRDALTFPLASGESVEQASLAVDGELGIAGRLHLFHLVAPRSAAASDAPPAGMIANQMALIEKIARELVVACESAASAIHRAEQLEMPGQLLAQFQRVEAASMSAFDSVAGLLDFSRIEGSAVTLELAPFKLRESVATMIASVIGRAEERRVQLKVRIEQDVPEHLTGDAARLMQALRSLIDCAIEASPLADSTDTTSSEPGREHERATEITLSVSPEYSADRQIHLSFSIEQLVRPAARPTSLPASATMQLALSRQIVRALAGGGAKVDARLEVQERKLGTSYQFTAAFPFDDAKPHKPRPTYVTLTGLPVLIVSEDTEERRQLADMAKSWRMVPREADNANVALQLLARNAKEGSEMPLVITSNRLTTQDGFLLAFRIKHHPAMAQTAIIMLASEGKPGDAITCRENGISAYLRQPVAPQQLNEAITAVIGAQDDAEATSTLITRHSLREQKKAAVLIIDATRDKIAFVSAALKKKGYRVVLVGSAPEAFDAMAQEQFDVVVVDPDNAGFVEGINVVVTIKSHVGEGRDTPKILLASESPLGAGSAYDGMVLKPFVKDSLLNAMTNLNLPHPSH